MSIVTLDPADQIEYPRDAPPTSSFERVNDILYWVRLPLALPLGHINLWLIDDGDGWTLVDTGLNHEVCREAWNDILPQIEASKPLTRLIITHHHPDHIGLAGWLQRRSKCAVFMSEPTNTIAKRGRLPVPDHDRRAIHAFGRLHGVEDPEQMAAFWCGDFYKRVVSELPEVSRFIEDDDEIRIGGLRWRVRLVNGHASGHVTLFSPDLDVLISGDQVLPRISPNISVHPFDQEADPLAEYLASLDRLRTVGEPLVLPSHGRIFRGLPRRCDELRSQHAGRLDRALELCQQSATVGDVLADLYPQAVDTFNMALAFGETLAHLRFLETQGRLRRSEVDGLCRFSSN